MAEIHGVTPPKDSSNSSKAPPSTPHHFRASAPSVQTLRSWLPLYLHKADSTVAHLNRILSTPSGTDSLLCTLQYSTLATSALLTTISIRRLHAQLLALLALTRLLPTKTTILITPPASSSSPSFPPSSTSAIRLLRLSQSLAKLSSLISDCRMFVRLWGLLGIYSRARGLAQKPATAEGAGGGGGRDRVLDNIAWAQLLGGVAYQVLENGAYLASKGIISWDARKQASAWLWSSRFWMAHVGLELTRLAYLGSERARGRRKGKGRDDGAGVVVGGAEEADVAAWRRDLISNMAYAPLTVHYSTNKGFVGELWIGVLGTIAGGVGFTQVWKNTA